MSKLSPSLYTFDFLSSSLRLNFSSTLYAFDSFFSLYTFNFSSSLFNYSSSLLYLIPFTSIPTPVVSEPVLSEFSSVLNLSFSSSLFVTTQNFMTNITRKYNFSELVNIPIFELNFVTDNQALRFLSEMTALRRSDIAKVLAALRNLIKLSVEQGVDKIYLLAFDIQILRKDDKTVIVISRY